jgi:hypothetical protein
MSDTLSVEQFQQALPPQIKQTINQELIDSINNSISDPEALEIYKENLLSFTSVLQQGKFKLSSYLNAVRYVGFKVMGSSNQDAYIRTFPDKYSGFLASGVAAKDIASYITAYNKSKLVNLIFEQALIPTHILNAPLFQRALNVQADLMMNAKSEMVRMQAANSLLTQLKPPEVKKIELDIGMKEDSTIQTLRESTLELVEQQKKLLAAGATALDIAHSSLVIESTLEEVSV